MAPSKFGNFLPTVCNVQVGDDYGWSHGQKQNNKQNPPPLKTSKCLAGWANKPMITAPFTTDPMCLRFFAPSLLGLYSQVMYPRRFYNSCVPFIAKKAHPSLAPSGMDSKNLVWFDCFFFFFFNKIRVLVSERWKVCTKCYISTKTVQTIWIVCNRIGRGLLFNSVHVLWNVDPNPPLRISQDLSRRALLSSCTWV